MGLLQLVHRQVHRASSAVCHHVAVSCSSEREHTLAACLAPSALRLLPTSLLPCSKQFLSPACRGGDVEV